MKVRAHSVLYRLLFAVTVLFVIGADALPAAAQISVTSTTPNNASQGTVSLDVTISGKGFKSGAHAQWFVTGTTNPGGVVVNSTAFVNANTLTANITVADTAVIGNFDVVVTNTDGRTGKVSELFAITSNGNNSATSCVNGPAAGWTQTSVVNNGQYTAGGFGVNVRVRLITSTDPVTGLLVKYYIGLVGSGAGKQTVLFTMDLNGVVQSSTLVATTFSGGTMAVGDFDGDGVLDWAVGAPNSKIAHVLFGKMSGTQYSIDTSRQVTIPAPSGSVNFGRGVAAGDLDGNGQDEIVIGDVGGGTGKSAIPGSVYVYRYADNSNSTNWTNFTKFTDPSGAKGVGFGDGVAIGKVTEATINGVLTAIPDLVIGSDGANSGSGVLWILQDPLHSVTASTLPTYTIVGPSNTSLGYQVGIADVTGDGMADIVAVSNGIGGTSGAQKQADVFAGPITGNNAPATYVLVPTPGLDGGWGTHFDLIDVDGDGRADVLVGAPNVSSGSCQNAGTAYLYFASQMVAGGTQTSPSGMFELTPAQIQSSYMGFGYGVAGVPSQGFGMPSIIAISENGANLNGVTNAGQVYIFKK